MKTEAVVSQDAAGGTKEGGNEERMVRGSVARAKERLEDPGVVLRDMDTSMDLADAVVEVLIVASAWGEGVFSMPAM
jgi:hypothetical protein